MKRRSLPVASNIEPCNAVIWKEKIPPIHFHPGQVLFYRGHLPYGILIIHTGYAELRRRESDQTTQVRVGPNTVLGLANVVEELPYPRTAVAIENLEASFVERSLVSEWMKS